MKKPPKDHARQKWEMRKKGMKWREIAAHFGISIPSAFVAAQRYESTFYK
jgi:transposase